MADAHYQHYQMDPRQQPYYQQQPQSISPPQYNPNMQYGRPEMGHSIPPQQMAPPAMHSVSPQHHQQHMGNAMPPQQMPDPRTPDGQGAMDEYGGNPIPMSQSQLATLLENIALLDTQRIILEPGVMIGETGQILNLNVIRSKVNSTGYTLPEMLVDLNSICEPFLNQGPDHAAYATNFLDQANQAIVDSVRDAQFASGAPHPPDHGGYPMQQQQQHHQPGYGQPQDPGYPPADQRSHPNSWVSQVVGEDGQGAAMDRNAAYMNGRMPPDGYAPHVPGHGMASPPEGAKRKGGVKRGPDTALMPDREKKANAQTAPRPRLEGRRCQVCAVIKKAGCGTENAHFRCLKKKKPDIAIELEKRVGELKDVGEEERVTVWNPKEGRKLSGQAAPMLKNLAGWLASHPGWEAHPRVTAGNTKFEAAFQGLPRAEGSNPSSGMGALTPQSSVQSGPPQMQQPQPPAVPLQHFQNQQFQAQVPSLENQGHNAPTLQGLPAVVDQGPPLQPQVSPYLQQQDHVPSEQSAGSQQAGYQEEMVAQGGYQPSLVTQSIEYPPDGPQSGPPQQLMPPALGQHEATATAAQPQQLLPSPGQHQQVPSTPQLASPQQVQQHEEPQQQASLDPPPEQQVQQQYGTVQEVLPQHDHGQGTIGGGGQIGGSFQSWEQEQVNQVSA